MREPGHIYVLVNPSIEGLVKIGKTTRSPDERAKEMSQATGVPTPFYAAYAIQVADCHSAEEHVYALLEQNGIKRSPNREFFEMPLRAAIAILLLAERQLEKGATSRGQPVDDEPSMHPGRVIMTQAMDALYGTNDTIKDKEEALRLLIQAKALNFPAAYTSLSEYFAPWHKPDPDWQKALEILKEGVRNGHGRCFVKMATIYHIELNDRESARKCWKKYFESSTFRNDDDTKWTKRIENAPCALGLDLMFDEGSSRLEFAMQYLTAVFRDWVDLDPKVIEIWFFR